MFKSMAFFLLGFAASAFALWQGFDAVSLEKGLTAEEDQTARIMLMGVLAFAWIGLTTIYAIKRKP